MYLIDCIFFNKIRYNRSIGKIFVKILIVLEVRLKIDN